MEGGVQERDTFRNEARAKKAEGEYACFIARTILDVSSALMPTLMSH